MCVTSSLHASIFVVIKRAPGVVFLSWFNNLLRILHTRLLTQYSELTTVKSHDNNVRDIITAHVISGTHRRGKCKANSEHNPSGGCEDFCLLCLAVKQSLQWM